MSSILFVSSKMEIGALHCRKQIMCIKTSFTFVVVVVFFQCRSRFWFIIQNETVKRPAKKITKTKYNAIICDSTTVCSKYSVTKRTRKQKKKKKKKQVLSELYFWPLVCLWLGGGVGVSERWKSGTTSWLWNRYKYLTCVLAQWSQDMNLRRISNTWTYAPQGLKHVNCNM